MHIEKSYGINLWSEWDYEVDNAVYHFFEEYGMMPNGLVANPWSISQFDYMASITDLRNNTFNYDPKTKEYIIPIGKDETIEIAGLRAYDGEYDLEFYLSESFVNKEFALFFTDEVDDNDDDDDDDDENETPVPVDNPVLIEVF